MNNIIELVVGDWSYDGHNLTRSFHYTTNLSRAELLDAFSAGETILGLSLLREVDEYEQDHFSDEFNEALESQGLTPIYDSVSTQEYAELYMQIAKLGNPALEYEQVKFDSINIGGYGLFHF